MYRFQAILLVVLLCSLSKALHAQDTIPIVPKAEVVTALLLEEKKWDSLLIAGRNSISNGRFHFRVWERTGQAAYMRGKYALALGYLVKATQLDPESWDALYLAYKSSLELNKPECAHFFFSRLPLEIRAQEGIKQTGLTAFVVEIAPRLNATTRRGNILYRRLGMEIKPGHKWTHQHNVSYQFQRLSEPALKNLVHDVASVNMLQWSYAANVSYAISVRVALKAAFHYQYTSFDDWRFDNNVLMGGIKFTGNFFDIQADAMICQIMGLPTQQLNLETKIQPLGNAKLEAELRSSFQTSKGYENWLFEPKLGVKLLGNLGVEWSGVFSEYNHYVTKDAQYLWTYLDPTVWKTQFSIILKTQKLALQLSYQLDRRKLYNSDIRYSIHSPSAIVTYKF